MPSLCRHICVPPNFTYTLPPGSRASLDAQAHPLGPMQGEARWRGWDAAPAA